MLELFYLTFPLTVAPVSVIPVAATVVASGCGGAATRMLASSDPAKGTKRSPALSTDVLTSTGTLLLVVLLLPN